MINSILKHIEGMAPIDAIAALEQHFAEVKNRTQPPTILDSSIGKVTFSIPPVSTYTSQHHQVIATLSPEAGATPTLFAFPEFAVFSFDAANPRLSKLFPYYGSHLQSDPTTTQAEWNTSYWYTDLKAYEHILDVNWWMSWGRTNNSNLVALINIRRDDYGGKAIVETDHNADGVTASALNLDVYISWRFLRPGAS